MGDGEGDPGGEAATGRTSSPRCLWDWGGGGTEAEENRQESGRSIPA